MEVEIGVGMGVILITVVGGGGVHPPLVVVVVGHQLVIGDLGCWGEGISSHHQIHHTRGQRWSLLIIIIIIVIY